MGLDVVELVLECEQVFGVHLENWRLEQMRTVGDLFELVCEQLQLPFGPDAPKPNAFPTSIETKAVINGWTRAAVWSRLVAVCVYQLQVDQEDIRYDARFQEDLGAD